MKNKFKFVIILAALSALCLIGAACSGESRYDNYIKDGYNVIVTFDSNGGRFVGKENNQVVDLYNPDRYEADANGNVSIKLTVPTGRKIGGETATLTMPDHFVAGWYRTRTLKTDADGSPVDENGRAITERNGKYFYADGSAATPAYDYSGLWNFDTDVIEYKKGSGAYELTLYAGWVRYFEFDYYVETDSGWRLLDVSTFDYITNRNNAYDLDTIWTPAYSGGKMVYTHPYISGGEYRFPKPENATFNGAYLSEDKTDELGASFHHTGTLDLEHCSVTGRVVNVYCTFVEGERFRIETAEQFAANFNAQGIYEITADLDFSFVKWPSGFATSAFKGRIYSTEGHTYKFANVKAEFVSSSSNAKTGGVFGELSAEAKIENITFENVTFDVKYCATRLRNSSFALFSGRIDDGATLENVTLSGTLEFRFFGNLAFDTTSYSIALTAGGAAEKLNVISPVKLVVYGDKIGETYRYAYSPELITVDETGKVTLTFVSLTSETESFVINEG